MQAGVLMMFAAATMLISGCGSMPAEKRQDDFFTSGSREADQRASQRMARDEQLSGSGEGAGDKEKTKEAKPGQKGNVGGANGDGGAQAAQAEGKLTLYDRLGGAEGIAAIIEDFTPRVLEDPRVNWARKGVESGGLFRRDKAVTWNFTPQKVAVLKKHMAQFLALATGGPARYDGRDMKTVHGDMQITNPEFDAAIGDLKASLDRLQIPNQEQKELLAIIESTRPQIVTER